MEITSLYNTKVKATGGRNGKVESTDGILSMDVRMPKELGGTGGEYTNPEQLFAAGYSACFDGALNLVARQQKMHLKGTEVSATVGIGKNAEGELGLEVKLEVLIPGTDKETAQQLLEKAHQVCPYSLATRNNIKVELVLVN